MVYCALIRLLMSSLVVVIGIAAAVEFLACCGFSLFSDGSVFSLY